MKANYWVIAHGTDCDGFNNGKIYPFTDQEEAIKFTKHLNDGSDGLIYQVINNLAEMIEYCEDYGKDYINYIEI